MNCDNNRPCTCTYSCGKRHKCCECVAYHRDKNQIPGCFFSKNAEATYDRSIENFIKDYQNNR